MNRPRIVSRLAYWTALAARPDLVVLDVALTNDDDAEFLENFIRSDAAVIHRNGSAIHLAVTTRSRHFSNQRGAVKWIIQVCTSLGVKVKWVTSSRTLTSSVPEVFDQLDHDPSLWGMAFDQPLPPPWISMERDWKRRAATPAAMVLLALIASFAVAAGSHASSILPLSGDIPALFVAGMMLSIVGMVFALTESTPQPSGPFEYLLWLVLLSTGAAGAFTSGSQAKEVISFWMVAGILLGGVALFAIASVVASLFLRAVRSNLFRGIAGLGVLGAPVIFVGRALTRGIAAGLGVPGADLSLRTDLVFANHVGSLVMILGLAVIYVVLIVKATPSLGEGVAAVFLSIVVVVGFLSGWSVLGRESQETGSRIRHGELGGSSGLAHIVCLDDKDKTRNQIPFVLVGGGSVGSVYFRYEQLKPDEKPRYPTFFAAEPVPWRAVDEWSNGKPICKALA